MPLDSQKELHPVYVSEYGLKVIYRLTFQANRVAFPLHWHDNMEFLRIREGSLILSCASHQLTLLPGDVGVISSQMLHTGLSGPEGVVYDVLRIDYALLCNGTTTSDTYLQGLHDGSCQFEPLVRNDSIRQRLDDIVEARRQPDKQHPMQLLALLYDLSGLLYKHCTIQDILGLPAQKQLGQVIDYINDHYTENISSAMLSQLFGHDEAYFCRKFKKHTGLTIMKYIQILRMEKARKLLVETALSVQDIAVSCGFSDAAYFNNCFKKLYRITPSQMRQRAADNAFDFQQRKQ
jgi:AraC-like DNA-binding protein